MESLAKRGIHGPLIYVVCKENEERNFHFFSKQKLANGIWVSLYLGLRIQRTQGLLSWNSIFSYQSSKYPKNLKRKPLLKKI
jgi:hypothetical protein